MSRVSTALCSVEKMVAREERDAAEDVDRVEETGASSSSSPTLCASGPGVIASSSAATVGGELNFDEAVDMALAACGATSPNDRFRLIETPNENFLLVTNVLPKENAPREDGTVSDRALDVTDAVLDEFSAVGTGSATRSPGSGGRDYVLREAAGLSYDGHLLHCVYTVYRKEHLEKSLSADKRSMIEEVLRCVDTPGLLDHNNVCDVEALLWLLYCGPCSLCQSDRCLGYDKNDVKVPFPALLPPIFYESVTDHLTYVNIAELYVFVWYRNYDFGSECELGSGSGLGGLTLERARDTLNAVRARFADREVPLWSSCSRTCIFCALYQQNRLCLDFATGNVLSTSYGPIVLKDCRHVMTNVTLSHILPGQNSVTLFPIYDIGALLSALSRTPSGAVEFASF